MPPIKAYYNKKIIQRDDKTNYRNRITVTIKSM